MVSRLQLGCDSSNTSVAPTIELTVMCCVCVNNVNVSIIEMGLHDCEAVEQAGGIGASCGDAPFTIWFPPRAVGI